MCARRDAILQKSIISRAAAEATHFQCIPCSVETVQDSAGNSYQPFAYVDLRWNRQDSAKTFSQRFFVVHHIPSAHGTVFGAGAGGIGVESMGPASLEFQPLGLRPQTEGLDSI